MRIFLRALNTSDSSKIYPWLLNKKNHELTCGNFYFASEDYLKKWIEERVFSRDQIYLAICLKTTNEIIGYLSLKNIDHRNRVTILGGILIGDEHNQGSGLASEAVKLMLEFAFNELNINMLWTYVLEEHHASPRLLEKNGFKRTGILPQSVYKSGKYHNQIIFCILRKDYNPDDN